MRDLGGEAREEDDLRLGGRAGRVPRACVRLEFDAGIAAGEALSEDERLLMKTKIPSPAAATTPTRARMRIGGESVVVTVPSIGRRRPDLYP